MSITINYPTCEGVVLPGNENAVRATIVPRFYQVPASATGTISDPTGRTVWSGSAPVDGNNSVCLPIVFPKIAGRYHLKVEFFGEVGISLGVAEHDFSVSPASLGEVHGD